MKCGPYLLAVCVLCLPALAQAQDFGVMESAETIDKGNFKLRANPVLIFSDDSRPGIAGAAGYGFTNSLDAEVKLAHYDGGITIIGGDVEFWLLKKPHPVDLSVSAGFHFSNSEFLDQTGIDVTVIASHAVRPKLDVFAALDLAFNKYRNVSDSNYTQAHLVPGIEYKIHANLDLVAEVGIALNDNGDHYISGGIAYYLR